MISRRLAPKVVVAAAVLLVAWLLASGRPLAETPPGDTGVLAATGVVATPAPTPTVASVMMGGMGPFRVPPAPTAVTSFYDPAQRQQGAEVYEQRCSTCHGDRGQGLTPEWRATWPEGEQNCWQSKCHASNHPPDGFRLPEYVPPVIGGASLARFQTALQLFEYLRAQMPYHAPGILSDEDYWALTAFLLDAHRVPAKGLRLDVSNAADVRLRPAPTPVPQAVSWRLVASGAAVLLGLVGLIVWRRTSR